MPRLIPWQLSIFGVRGTEGAAEDEEIFCDDRWKFSSRFFGLSLPSSVISSEGMPKFFLREGATSSPCCTVALFRCSVPSLSIVAAHALFPVSSRFRFRDKIAPSTFFSASFAGITISAVVFEGEFAIAGEPSPSNNGPFTDVDDDDEEEDINTAPPPAAATKADEEVATDDDDVDNDEEGDIRATVRFATHFSFFVRSKSLSMLLLIDSSSRSRIDILFRRPTPPQHNTGPDRSSSDLFGGSYQ